MTSIKKSVEGLLGEETKPSLLFLWTLYQWDAKTTAAILPPAAAPPRPLGHGGGKDSTFDEPLTQPVFISRHSNIPGCEVMMTVLITESAPGEFLPLGAASTLSVII